MSSSNYQLLLQFDGNLTDASANNATVNVDSGTPAYVTGDFGQALTISSATLSTTIPNLFSEGFNAFNFKLKVATGATDGIIWSIDCDTLGAMCCYITAGNVYVRTVPKAQNTSTAYARVYIADTWETWSTFATTSRYLNNSSGQTQASTDYLSPTYWDSWPSSQCTLYFGKLVNCDGISGMPTNTPATGVDIDFIAYDNSNEGNFVISPTPNDLREMRVAAAPDSPAPYATSGEVPALSPTFNATLTVQPGGGGGPSGPVQKEFWS